MHRLPARAANGHENRADGHSALWNQRSPPGCSTTFAPTTLRIVIRSGFSARNTSSARCKKNSIFLFTLQHRPDKFLAWALGVILQIAGLFDSFGEKPPHIRIWQSGEGEEVRVVVKRQAFSRFIFRLNNKEVDTLATFSSGINSFHWGLNKRGALTPHGECHETYGEI